MVPKDPATAPGDAPADGSEDGADAADNLPAVPAEVPERSHALWHVLLRAYGRTPRPRDMEVWEQRLARGMDARAFLRQIVASRPFRETKFVRAHSPPGHYYSPVVDPDAVRAYVEEARRAGAEDLAGIVLDLDAMEGLWRANRDWIAATPFTEAPRPDARYAYLAGPYAFGDAITLRAMMGHFRPRRIVEIGSGLSTACMLDTAEELGLAELRLTCVEPHPGRLRSLLRPGDEARIALHERPVQDMPLDLFRALEPNDILFIDSSHVLKTGSDVHFELFHILPALARGVIVHFHDCRFPLEYSDIQIFRKNYSWNEAYAVRALLMDSTRYRVIFWGSLFALHRAALVRETCADFLRNPGSALWIRVE
jgi:predicted O-methyltransferase YrrM